MDNGWFGPVVGAGLGLMFLHGIEEHNRKYHGHPAKHSIKRSASKRTVKAKRKRSWIDDY